MNKNYIFKVIKLIACIHLIALLQFSYATHGQTLTFHGKHVPMSKVLNAIKQQTEFEVLGTKSLLDLTMPVDVAADNMPLESFLEHVFKGQKLTYEIVDKTIVLKQRPALISPIPQQQPIRGQIVGPQGTPLPSATIHTSDGTVAADQDGRFTLDKMPEDRTLTISMIGYKRLVYKLQDGVSNYVITLEEESNELEQLVVTGYQVIRRDSYTGTAVTKSGEELQQVNPQNVLQAMQVFDPSFKILDNNLLGSNPNALPNITVRGSSALPTGNNEVLRRDNITSTVNMPAFFLDGYEVSVEKVLDLDMSRIESVTLLKDAAATAIYGSRASNGVMVITTKTPQEGTLRVSYSHETNINGPDLTDYRLLNAADKLEYERLAGLFDNAVQSNMSQDFLDELYYHKLENVLGGVDTYWLSQPLRTAVGQKHGLYVEGGSPVFRYGIDARYQTRPGVMKGSGRDQYSGAMSFSYNLNNRIRFQNVVDVSVVEGHESPYGNFFQYVRMNPYYRMTDDNGNIIQEVDVWHSRASSGQPLETHVLNPMYNSTLSNFDQTRYTDITNNLTGEFELMPGLKLRGQLSFIKRMNRGDQYLSPLSNEFYFYAPDRTNEKGRYTSSSTDETYWDGNVRLNWLQRIDEHDINLVAGTNIRTERSDWRRFTAIGFPNDHFSNIGFARGYEENATPESELNEARLFGAFLSTNYSWRNTYLLDATIRADGSSKFGANNRTAPFWSLGLGWNVHQENWFGNGVVNQLRIRATTGLTGSVQFSPYMSRTTYNYDQNNWYSSGIGTIVNNYGNDDLTWQKTRSTDIGFDLGLFGDRIYISPRVYHKLTKDILTDINIAPSTGFGAYKENLGDMENRGIELNMNLVAVRNQDWTLSFMANMVSNSNKIVRISNALKSYNDRVNDAQGGSNLMGVPLLRYNEGQSIDAIYAVPSLGIDPETGQEVFLKRDGTISYVWDTDDITVVGVATPKLEGFFGGTLRYKEWMLVAHFQTRWGGEMYNQTLVDRVENADPRFNVDRRVFEEKWKQPGDVSFYKNIADLGQTRVSSRFIMPDNLLAIQSLRVSYEARQAFANQLGLSSLRLGVTTNELARWSSIRQERGISYPFAQSISFTLQAAL